MTVPNGHAFPQITGCPPLSRPESRLTGVERTFSEDDIIVSKTDLKGIITYANRTFLDVASYTLPEIMNKPHNIVRHPGMPRVVFKLLWDTIARGDEIFAYVLNQAKNGDHYWVYAHVTPSFDEKGKIVGYHSNRRVPKREGVKAIEPIYKLLLDKEKEFSSPKEGIAAAEKLMLDFLKSKDVSYERFVLSL